MDRDVLSSLFTRESILSFQGAAAVTLLVPSVLTYLIGPAFQPYEKWVAFIVAMLVSVLIGRQASDKSWIKWLVAVLNGFLIFASAVGISTAASGGMTASGAETVERLPFFHPWYP